MDAQLKAVVGADVSNFVAGIDQAKAKIADLFAKMDQLKANQTELFSRAAIADSNKQIEGVAQQIDKLQGNLKDSTSSFDAFGGAISKQRVALVDMGRILTGTGFTVRSLGSQLALFPLPVVAAVAAIALLGAELYKLAAADSDAEAAQRLLNTTINESDASTAGEIAGLQDLVGIIINETNSRQLRSDAFKKLQDQYPNAFKNMSLEKTSLQDLQVATDKLTNALIRQAQIKGVESAIADIAKQQADLLNQSATGFFSSLNVFDKLKLALGGAGEAGAILGDEFKKGNDASAALNGKLKELITTALQLNDDGILGKDNSKTIKVQDENIQYLEKVKKLVEDLSKKDTNPLFKDFAESAAGALGNINLQLYQDNLKKATEAAAKGAITPETLTQYASALKDAFDKVASPNLKSVIRFDLQDNGSLETEFDTIMKKLDKEAYIKLNIAGFDQIEVQKAYDAAQKLADSINKILTRGIADGLGNVAGAVGEALGSGGNVLKAAGDALLSTIGGLIEQLGKALLEYGLAQEAVKVAFETFSPELAIAAGAAAIIVGAALKGVASKPHAFAEGGIVTGPTNALIGEAGPEVVFPLAQLNKFVRSNTSGQNMNVNVTGRISGRDLLLVHDKATTYRNMAT